MEYLTKKEDYTYTQSPKKNAKSICTIKGAKSLRANQDDDFSQDIDYARQDVECYLRRTVGIREWNSIRRILISETPDNWNNKVQNTGDSQSIVFKCDKSLTTDEWSDFSEFFWEKVEQLLQDK